VFAAKATARGGLQSEVREKVESLGPAELNAHAELLSPSDRPKFNGPISGPRRIGMGPAGSAAPLDKETITESCAVKAT
jgi:hypothetical protein